MIVIAKIMKINYSGENNITTMKNSSLKETEDCILLIHENYKIIFTKKDAGNFSFQQPFIDENLTTNSRKKFFEKFEIPSKNVYNPILEHGSKYFLADKPLNIDACYKNSQIGIGDAVLVLKPDLYGMITFADCIPLALLNRKANICAAIHLGWRGVIDLAILKMISAWNKIYDVSNVDWEAIIGPSIFANNFEVQSDFIENLNKSNRSMTKFLINIENKYYFNNRVALSTTLQDIGIYSCFQLDIDTFSDSRFSSYRKEKPYNITQALLVTMIK
ncbi:MAG TPA: polyphenol oxidase family protein [Exilispira sp.]|nr:polyphenol oxidase family protein [Exilispira sp.]